MQLARWRCVQHYLFRCKASPLGCPDPTDLWADLSDILPPEAPARSPVRLGLHMSSFGVHVVRAHCVAWLLDPFLFLQGCPRSLCVAVCSVLPAHVLLVGASVSDDAVPAGARVFASALVHRSLCPLALLPACYPTACVSVAGRCPPPFRPAGGAEAEAPSGSGMVPKLFFFFSIPLRSHPRRFPPTRAPACRLLRQCVPPAVRGAAPLPLLHAYRRSGPPHRMSRFRLDPGRCPPRRFRTRHAGAAASFACVGRRLGSGSALLLVVVGFCLVVL
jgi:hypothetical protein